MTLPVAARACGRGNALAALGIFIAGAAAGVALAAVAGKQPGRTPAAARAPAPIASAVPSGGYSVEVVRLSDGDTFEARVLVWPGVEIVTKVRLRGIDAPELSARCRDEYAKAIAARDALGAMLREGGVRLTDIGPDKYNGRVVARVATRSTADVSRALLASGHARAYGGGRREGWCAE